MSNITPVPEKLPEDLNEIKSLIEERTSAIAKNDAEIASINSSSDVYRAELKILQDEILVRTNLKTNKENAGTTQMVNGKSVTYDNQGNPIK